MKRPGSLLRWLGLLLFLLLFFVSATTTVQGASQITLTGMEKQERVSSTRITLRFSDLPKFEIVHSGQRVDLQLIDVRVSAKLRNLPEDETVVRILLAQKSRDLMTSFLLRRPPVQVHTEALRNPARIVMELSWQRDLNSRPGVAFRIADMPPRKAGKQAQDYVKESPWKDRWLEFFRDYRTDWNLDLPLRYTLPVLPGLISDEQSPLWSLQQFADEKKWLSLLRATGQLSGLDERQRYLRDLLAAEAQLRRGSFAAGLARLQRLQGRKGHQKIRVDYLTAFAQAKGGQPHVAQLGLQGLLPDLSGSEPLAACVYLLAAETALASGRGEQALSYLLNTDLVWPDALLDVVALRRADARVAVGEPQPALEIYQGLIDEPKLCETYRFSCSQAAYTAYQQHQYPLATRRYRILAELLQEQSAADLVMYAAGAAAYAAGDREWGIIGLQKAALDRPNSEGGERAELRLIDDKLLVGATLERAQAASDYGRLGKQSSTRLVREEAVFKRALTLYLLEDHADSVQELMRFRREFSSSRLRREADLLLLEQLPKVVDLLLGQGNDLQAVVLVEQNRNLLLRGGFSRAFLQNLAGAFKRLGLHARASRVLLYLLDQAPDEAQRKPIYLPLAQAYLQRDEFGPASDYAGRYLEKYPQGRDASALFGVLLDAFERQGRWAELSAWLNRENRPSSPELEARAAWIYWQQEQPKQVVKCLERASKAGGKLAVKEMALLGEAYYRLKRGQEAEKIYRGLHADEQFSAQARYRSAQLLLRQQDRAGALKLLAQLVEEDGNSRWGTLARDLLIQEKQ